LNDDLDAELKEGVIVNCMIVRNKLTELKYKNEQFKRDEFLQLSLKNSLIKGAKQHYLHDYLAKLNMPLILGISKIAENDSWIDNRTVVRDHLYNNETILNNLISELDINQYGLYRLAYNNYSFKSNAESGFSYEK
jgi:hypothetical protein